MKCPHSILRGVGSHTSTFIARFQQHIPEKLDSLGVSALPEVPSCLEGWSDTEDTHWHFYTDGGADPPEITNGKVTAPSRAGWGVVVWRPDHVHEFCGPVVTSVRTPGFLCAQRATNNMGELSAILQIALQFALFHRSQVSIMYIHYDSEYAAQVTQGHWKVHKNIDLARRAQKLWACARHFFHVEFVWVKGHDGHLGNEKADACATLGKQKQVQDMPLGP